MIVVDTNILAYRCFPGPRTAAVEALIQLDPHWSAPLLWRSEFRNVVAGYLRAGKLTPPEAENLLHQAVAMLLGGEHFISDAAVVACLTRSRCTAYDCEFAALAESLDVLLVTEDKALLEAFPRRCRSLDAAVQGKRGVAP